MPLTQIDARQKLDEIKHMLFARSRPLPPPLPPYVLFITDGSLDKRSSVRCFSGECSEKLWESVICQLAKRVVQKNLSLSNLESAEKFSCGIKFEIVTECHSMPLERLKHAISATKRNYFRFGVSFDAAFERAFTEAEINANAMFYLGPGSVNGGWNAKNIIHYMNDKYKNCEFILPAECDLVHTFVTSGAFLNDDNQIYSLHSKGVKAGRRHVDSLTDGESRQAIISQVAQSATEYLCNQINENGYMRYGYFPVFDRPIPGRNSLRQACATLALLHSYQEYRRPRYLKSARHSITYLVNSQVKSFEINGKITSFLIDSNEEIKLGGCGLLLLILVRHKEVSGSTIYDDLMLRLAWGIIEGFPQGPDGIPSHVLCSKSLAVKEQFRTVYYEGEAMYGLASFYQHFKYQSVLSFLENTFDALIKAERWRSRDHWLAYACDKMYEITSDTKYVELAAKNVKGYLSFICHRQTAFPTLLELCSATDRLAHRYGADLFYKKIDSTPEGFKFATSTRAKRLLDAYCWPEVAMNFKSPAKILGSFFIRHQAFRVRVDDVGHFILGLLSYEKTMGKTGNR